VWVAVEETVDEDLLDERAYERLVSNVRSMPGRSAHRGSTLTPLMNSIVNTRDELKSGYVVGTCTNGSGCMMSVKRNA
jgi:hypothetical protein